MDDDVKARAMDITGLDAAAAECIVCPPDPYSDNGRQMYVIKYRTEKFEQSVKSEYGWAPCFAELKRRFPQGVGT